VFPHQPMNGGDQPPPAASRHRNGTLARRDADGRCDAKQSEDKAARAIGAAPPVGAKARPALAQQGERQECQRVSPKTPHPQGARSAGKSATLENPAHFLALPIVTQRAKTTGLVCAAHRAGCRQAASIQQTDEGWTSMCVRLRSRTVLKMDWPN
jgi:hypothetical protein